MAERLRTTAATVEAGNAATVAGLEDLRVELAEVKASLQDFVQGRFSFTFHAWAVEDAAARLASSPLAGGRDGLFRRRRRPFGADPP